MAVYNVTRARALLPELLDQVEGGDEVTITRHGRPVAVLVRPDRLVSRRAQEALTLAAEVHDLLEEARSTGQRAHTGITPERADELVAEVRAGRRSR